MKIEVSNLHKSYYDGEGHKLHILKGLNFEIISGSTAAITPPAGPDSTASFPVKFCWRLTSPSPSLHRMSLPGEKFKNLDQLRKISRVDWDQVIKDDLIYVA